ncbi:hypothetical protein L914_19040 [Phytophthora nicotianae]|nr:hypothetical protein L914_19040 [Phytophthora nicotianae]
MHRNRPHDALTSQVGDYRLLNDMAPLSWNGYGLVRSAKASACAVVEHNQDDDELVASASGED